MEYRMKIVEFSVFTVYRCDNDRENKQRSGETNKKKYHDV